MIEQLEAGGGWVGLGYELKGKSELHSCEHTVDWNHKHVIKRTGHGNPSYLPIGPTLSAYDSPVVVTPFK